MLVSSRFQRRFSDAEPLRPQSQIPILLSKAMSEMGHQPIRIGLLGSDTTVCLNRGPLDSVAGRVIRIRYRRLTEKLESGE